MPSSRNETQITWSTASSVTVSSATVVWSDAFLFNVEDWEAEVQVDANNAGTPATGDVCDVYIAYTTGDILGDFGKLFLHKSSDCCDHFIATRTHTFDVLFVKNAVLGEFAECGACPFARSIGDQGHTGFDLAVADFFD